MSHYKTPQRPDPPKSKRRTLPWAQSQKQEPIQEEEEQEETTHPRKRVSKAVDRPFSTPAKDSKSQSFFNTTASALKQQRTTFREANKAQAKAHQGTDEDMKEAIKKKKKNNARCLSAEGGAGGSASGSGCVLSTGMGANTPVSQIE